MKSVLLALAVMAVCGVYEMERASLSPVWDFDPAQWNGEAARTALPRLLRTDETGSIEREQSIRLFGPGVSRRRQIRV